MSRPPQQPFFVSPGQSSGTRRLLLVCHNFPPDSSIGALRWEKMVGVGITHGWTTDVLMMDPSESEQRDEARLMTLPPGTRLFPVPWRRHPARTLEQALRWLRNRWRAARPMKEAGRGGRSAASRPSEHNESLWDSLRSWRRAQLAWLYYTEWEEWSRRAAVTGVQLCQQRQYDCVASSGPPHMAHEAARRISEATGTPFVMDLRDPWHGPSVEPYDMVSPTWRRLTAVHEGRCIEAATLVVANTPEIATQLRHRYPLQAGKLTIVMNGADPGPWAAGTRSGRFELLYAGDLYQGRDPRGLLKGLQIAVADLGVSPDQIGLRFLGAESYHGVPVRQLAEAAGLSRYVDTAPRVSRAEALAIIAASSMLVVLPQDQAECVPAKIFEYVQAPSWLLCITEEGSAVESLLRETDADLVAPGDYTGMARAIVRRYTEFANGKRPAPINEDGRFDRVRQAARLYEALDRIAAR